jgi:signal peptidase I
LEPLDETVSVEGSTAIASETDQDELAAAHARKRKSFWREVLETVVMTILIFFLVKSMVQNFRIQGSSMEPNFHTNQLLLVNKAAYFHFDVNAWLRIIPGVKADGTNVVWIFGGPHRGDVLVLEPPDVPTEDYIKRVIALPGEKIEVRDGIVYINDKPLKEDYIKEKPFSTYGPVTVPPNNLFVMGDNRNASRDSRIFGFLPFDKVVGKSMFVYWPFGSQWGIVPESKYE